MASRVATNATEVVSIGAACCASCRRFLSNSTVVVRGETRSRRATIWYKYRNTTSWAPGPAASLRIMAARAAWSASVRVRVQYPFEAQSACRGYANAELRTFRPWHIGSEPCSHSQLQQAGIHHSRRGLLNLSWLWGKSTSPKDAIAKVSLPASCLAHSCAHAILEGDQV
jgi:hypothetical protein